MIQLFQVTEVDIISQSREEFAYLQVERPVIDGLESFRAKADYIGRQVLGEVFRTTVTEFTTYGSEQSSLFEGHYREKQVPENQLMLERAKDLGLILLHRRVPLELSSRYSFPYHVGQFDGLRKPVYPLGVNHQLGRFKLTDLYSQLDQVSLDYDTNPNQLVVMCDNIDVIHDDGSEGVLALYPEPGTAAEQVIQKQIWVAERRLSQQSKRVAELPGSSTAGAIRLGTISKDVRSSKNRVLLDELKQYLPLRIVLGGVSAARSKHGRRQPLKSEMA